MRASIKKRRREKRIDGGYFIDGIGIIMPRLRDLGFKSYRSYLARAHWADVKSAYGIALSCELCSGTGTGKLQLHHRTYKNLGHETADDLIALCDSCHDRIHQSERMGGKGGLLGALKRASARSRKA